MVKLEIINSVNNEIDIEWFFGTDEEIFNMTLLYNTKTN